MYIVRRIVCAKIIIITKVCMVSIKVLQTHTMYTDTSRFFRMWICQVTFTSATLMTLPSPCKLRCGLTQVLSLLLAANSFGMITCWMVLRVLCIQSGSCTSFMDSFGKIVSYVHTLALLTGREGFHVQLISNGQFCVGP